MYKMFFQRIEENGYVVHLRVHLLNLIRRAVDVVVISCCLARQEMKCQEGREELRRTSSFDARDFF